MEPRSVFSHVVVTGFPNFTFICQPIDSTPSRKGNIFPFWHWPSNFAQTVEGK